MSTATTYGLIHWHGIREPNTLRNCVLSVMSDVFMIWRDHYYYCPSTLALITVSNYARNHRRHYHCCIVALSKRWAIERKQNALYHHAIIYAIHDSGLTYIYMTSMLHSCLLHVSPVWLCSTFCIIISVCYFFFPPTSFLPNFYYSLEIFEWVRKMKQPEQEANNSFPMSKHSKESHKKALGNMIGHWFIADFLLL